MLLSIDDNNVIVVLSDVIERSVTLPSQYLPQLLAIIHSNLQNRCNIEQALDLFSNILIRGLLAPVC